MYNYFPLQVWHHSDVRCALYTEAEPPKILRSFGDLSVRSTEGIIKEATGGILQLETCRRIDSIGNQFRVCATHASATGMFKLTFAAERLRLNHTVQDDNMFIYVKPVFHMADRAAKFCTERIRCPQTTSEVCRSKQSLSSLMYVGLPHVFSVDPGFHTRAKR